MLDSIAKCGYINQTNLNETNLNNKALFIDRDGTIHIDKVETHLINDLEFFHDTVPFMQQVVYTDSRVGSAGAWGTNVGIDVTYQGKKINAQYTFVMHYTEEHIKYAEEQVGMFEDVYNKVKEIYSDEGSID